MFCTFGVFLDTTSCCCTIMYEINNIIIIICEKVETKCGERKTERAENFASWKDKENAWQQMAPRAEKFGSPRFHRLL